MQSLSPLTNGQTITSTMMNMINKEGIMRWVTPKCVSTINLRLSSSQKRMHIFGMIQSIGKPIFSTCDLLTERGTDSQEGFVIVNHDNSASLLIIYNFHLMKSSMVANRRAAGEQKWQQQPWKSEILVNNYLLAGQAPEECLHRSLHKHRGSLLLRLIRESSSQ